MSDDSHSGKGGLVSLLILAVGFWVKKHAGTSAAQVITDHASDLRDALGYLVISGGALGTYLSHPPTWLRDPIVRTWCKLTGRPS